ncbi:hypothetical protein ADL19_30240 [Streptomyces purpurogeneiscleroticus]|jgi:hypothetical protein|nr:hypothetical protein ADL19_30240 [Streptomyces purpurogeneiscleroticus]
MAMSEAAEPDPHEALRTFLREQVRLAPSRKPSGYASVKAVLPEIKALKARCRTDAEIQEFLALKGVRLSLATLRQYIGSAARELAGHRPVRRRGKPASQPAAETQRAPAPHRPAPVAQSAVAAPDPLPARGHAPASHPVVGHRLSTKHL